MSPVATIDRVERMRENVLSAADESERATATRVAADLLSAPAPRSLSNAEQTAVIDALRALGPEAGLVELVDAVARALAGPESAAMLRHPMIDPDGRVPQQLRTHLRERAADAIGRVVVHLVDDFRAVTHASVDAPAGFGPFIDWVTGPGRGRLFTDHADALAATRAALAASVHALGEMLERVEDDREALAALTGGSDRARLSSVFGDEHAELDGSVEFVDASFSYPGAATEALRGVSFRVEPGERVAVVGPTGSGKTTLAQMLVGLHAPTAGEVRIGGRALRDVSPESLQRILAWVPQDVRLSSRSVAKNIDFGAEDPRMEEVVRAARAAALAPTVEAMPLGYHTHVGDLGGGLSGGQKQRVALARALVRSPRLLVLDEATSALDTITESLIVDALESLECTQIIIAHRLSTIARADRVIVVDEGRIVQQGTHDELIAREGTYRDLVHAQVEVRA